MDRVLVYPGALPQDGDLLSPQRNAMIALGYLMQAAFGTSTVADGLTCTQTTVPSMSVSVAPGSIMTNLTVDSTAFGSLAADTTDALVKMGINIAATAIGPFTAPGTPGQSQAFLIQAQVSETDGGATVLPYYNASNPASPYSGPANAGTAQNTQRNQRVLLQTKAGAPAVTGSQTTPSPDANFVGLWVVTIANGAASIINANIAQYPNAPFIPAKLGVGSLFGFGRQQIFLSSGTWTCPQGVTSVKARVWAGGGGSAGVNGAQSTAGGAGGGYAEGIFTVVPGTSYTVTVGLGGTAGAGTPTAGGVGGTSSFAAFCSATGGGGSTVGGGVTMGGSGSGGALNLTGEPGTGWGGGGLGGPGGGSPLGIQGGQPGSFNGASAGSRPGGGAGGAAATTGGYNGAAGGPGLVIVDW